MCHVKYLCGHKFTDCERMLWGGCSESNFMFNEEWTFPSEVYLRQSGIEAGTGTVGLMLR